MATKSLKESATKISILPDVLANRIAAGEVVERPSSVVKELLENSLDAMSSRIDIAIEGYGKKLIKISDNGYGMSQADARLAVQRHATSKIHSTKDLFSIKTLGFRGEALPSIASVSLFTLTTSDGNDPGLKISIEGGKLIREQEVAFPCGTQIEVRELFFNTPARRKFLKADSTELSVITETVQRIALSRPDVRIRYTHNNRELLNANYTTEFHERAAAVFGRKVYPRLFPVNLAGEKISVTGMISNPEYTRASPSQLHLFINGRAIKDRMLQHAITSAYSTMLKPKRFPIGAILLSMPADEVDVNVHPSKSEVRLTDGRQIYRFLNEAVREALGSSPWLNTSDYSNSANDSNQLPQRVGEAILKYNEKSINQVNIPIGGGYSNYNPNLSASGTKPMPLVNHHKSTVPGVFSSLTVLAQLHNSYILVSSKNGLGIIDQHAAHERVTFERLKKSFAAKKLQQQLLLLPVRLELDATRMAAFIEYQTEINELGFDVEAFGGDSIQIRAVPDILANADPGLMVSDLLDEYSDVSESISVESRIDHKLSTIACHASVRANDPLGYEQMISLLRQMDEIDFAASCPHGRPVYIEISDQELERRFERS